MTQPFTPLKLPALGLNPVANTGNPIVLNDLIARTWTGKVPRQRDATRVPVLPNAGLVRLRLGWTPDADPFGFIMVEEPTPAWGAQGTLLKLPAAAVVGGVSDFAQYIFPQLISDSGFMSGLSDARVMLGESIAEAINYSAHGTVTYITDDAYLGRIALDGAPFQANAPSTDFVGGDLIVAIQSLNNALNTSTYDDGSSTLGNGNLSTVAIADLDALIAAAAKYHRFRFRLYGGFDHISNLLINYLTGAGVDASYGGHDGTVSGPVSGIEADVNAFFGI